MVGESVLKYIRIRLLSRCMIEYSILLLCCTYVILLLAYYAFQTNHKTKINVDDSPRNNRYVLTNQPARMVVFQNRKDDKAKAVTSFVRSNELGVKHTV